jgi:hypothetical protein
MDISTLTRAAEILEDKAAWIRIFMAPNSLAPASESWQPITPADHRAKQEYDEMRKVAGELRTLAQSLVEA